MTDDAPTVVRENILQQIETFFAGATRVVVIEGEEGAGKSTLLRQLAAAREDQVISVFISAASIWAYNPEDIAHEIVLQIENLLGQPTDLSTDLSVDPTIYRRKLTGLTRRARASARPYYFIVDGLDDIPLADEASRTQIAELLPFGIDHFRFVLSGSLDTLPLPAAARRQTKALPLIPFSRDDQERYLQDLGLSSTQLKDIYVLTGGVPGRLASVRRILRAAPNPADEVSRLPESLSELFALEWAAVDAADELQQLLLAILAYENRPYTAVELAALTRESAAQIEKRLSLEFIQRDTDGRLLFISEGFRQFARKRLSSLDLKVNDLFIEHYLANPDTDEALSNLTTRLVSTGRFNELVKYLSPERFAHLYQRAPSLKLLQQKAEQGIQAARHLGKDSEIVRFAMQRSTIEQLAQSKAAVSEVRARTAIGDHDTALALADASPRSEVRLRLLAAIGRARREYALPPDPVLQERIESLLPDLDVSALRDELEDLAVDLFYILPDRAIELVTRGGATEQENAVDWGLARLAIEAQLAHSKKAPQEQVKSISERIRDPLAKQLSTAAILVLGKVAAAEAIAEAKQLEAVDHRLYVLRHWMRGNREATDAGAVLEYGLEEALKATAYTATPEIIRELSLCLPYLPGVHERAHFIRLIDAQRLVLERIGPPEEFVRLQLLLARAEWVNDRAAARARLEDTFLLASDMADIDTRTSTLARILAAVSRLRRSDEARVLEDLWTSTLAEFDAALEELLLASAEQESALRGTIEALAFGEEDRALAIVEQINTVLRRDECYELLIHALIQRPIDEIRTDILEEAVERIADPRRRDSAIAAAIERLSTRRLTASQFDRLDSVWTKVLTLTNQATRAVLAAKIVGVTAQLGEHAAPMRARYLAVLRAAWGELEDTSAKLDAGCEIVGDVARVAPDVAEEVIQRINAIKANLALRDPEATLAANLGLRLAIRAFSGLLRMRLEGESDVERILTAITHSGALEDQALLVREFALRCYLAGRHQECREIVEQHLLPLVYSIPESERSRRAQVIRRVAAALHVGAANTTRALLASLSTAERDEALATIGVDPISWTPHSP